MASIRKRGQLWQVQIRRKGLPPITRSFPTKDWANRWALETERNLMRGQVPSTIHDLSHHKLADLLARYRNEVTPQKRGASSEDYRVGQLMRDRIAALSMDRLTAVEVADYRDRRACVVAPATVRRELAILQHCLETARREWGVPMVDNPVRAIRLPGAGKARDRRLTPEEHEAVLSEATKGPSYLRPLVELALETGMRRGELLSLEWSRINWTLATAHLPQTKNGRPRTIALSPRALSILRQLPRHGGRVFSTSPNAVRLAWKRLAIRLQLHDFRFHDLRHEAISRFFELGLSMPEVALQSGHRDGRMLLRYTHLRPEALSSRLREISSSRA